MTTWLWTAARKRVGGPVVGFHKRGTHCSSNVKSCRRKWQGATYTVFKTAAWSQERMIIQPAANSIMFPTCSITLESLHMELVRRYTWENICRSVAALISFGTWHLVPSPTLRITTCTVMIGRGVVESCTEKARQGCTKRKIAGSPGLAGCSAVRFLAARNSGAVWCKQRCRGMKLNR